MEVYKLSAAIVLRDEATESLKNIQEGVNETKNSVVEKSSLMKSAFGKLGSFVKSAFSVDNIIQFGKQTVEAADKLSGLESRFNSTFNGQTKNAMNLINKQAKEQNIHVNRLKAGWADYYGSFKSSGISANNSLSLTQKLMNLSGDSTAHYGKSLTDVSDKMKSVIEGNFKAGSAIGFNKNATQMDILAKKKYSKAWEKLTSTQKANLVVDTLGKIYKENGALGAGAKGAKGYGNGILNLKASWEQFLKVLGTPIMNIAAICLDKIGKVLSKVAKQMSIVLKPFNDWIKSLKTNTKTTKLLSKALNKVKGTFVLLGKSVGKIVGTIIKSLINWYKNNKKTVNNIVKIISNCINMVKTIIKNGTTVIIAIWNKFGKYILSFAVAIFTGTLKKIQSVLRIINGVFQVFASLLKGDWKGAWEGIKNIVKGAFHLILNLVTGVFIKKFLGSIVKFGGKIVSQFKSIFNKLNNKVKTAVSSMVTGFKNRINKMLEPVKRVFGKIFEKMCSPFKKAKEKIGGIIDKIKNFFNFNWSLPKLKLPHLTATGEWSLLPPKVPSFDIQWYSTGAIFTKPTVLGNGIGVGDANNGMGSAAEAILPISELSSILGKTLNDLGIGSEKQIVININGQEVFNAMSPYFAAAVQGGR
ncbi:MAG: phage tail protein [Clostridium sp.]